MKRNCESREAWGAYRMRANSNQSELRLMIHLLETQCVRIEASLTAPMTGVTVNRVISQMSDACKFPRA